MYPRSTKGTREEKPLWGFSSEELQLNHCVWLVLFYHGQRKRQAVVIVVEVQRFLGASNRNYPLDVSK